MHPCRCIVAFTDSDGIGHEVEVWASTVYDAVAQAMRDFRQGSIARDLPGPHTEFSIAVHRAPVTHRLKLQQVTRWADGGGKSPREVIERNASANCSVRDRKAELVKLVLIGDECASAYIAV